MDGGAAAYTPNTVEEIFWDYKGRRAGIVKALTNDIVEFYFTGSAILKENLCLYGFPNEKWKVKMPAGQVSPGLPEPAVGINFSGDGLRQMVWLSLVAVHSDVWLLAVAFYFGGRSGLDKAERELLFNLINDIPNVFEVITCTNAFGEPPNEKSPVSNNSSNNPKSGTEERTPEPEKYSDEDEEEDHGDAVCDACGENYGHDQFWVRCDLCEKWFHGKCVNITPTRAEHNKQYKCPSCSSNKRQRP